MKIKPYVNKLHNSKQYKDFAKKNAGAFMMAGFFILDLESKKNIHQIDYYVPSSKKVAAFTLDKGVNMQMLSLMNSKVPEKLDIATKVDLDALYGILEDEMKNRNITDDVKKIIAVVQTIDGKKIWNLNCLLSGMGILRAHIDDDSRTVLKMEKASLLDYIKKVNPAELQAMGGGQMPLGGGMPAVGNGQAMQMPQQIQPSMPEGQESGASEANKKLSKKDIDERVRRLNQLEGAIEEEKRKLQGKEVKAVKEVKKAKKK